MKDKYISLQAEDDISNYTICVQEELYGTVRNMRFRSDVNSGNLVYVNNITKKGDLDTAIPQGTLCRCLLISVLAKEII